MAADAPSLAGFSRRLTLIGCGNMAGAMVARWLACGLSPDRIHVMRPSGAPVAPGIAVVREIGDLPRPADILMLGMKPQQFGEVAPQLAPLVGPGTCVVSILAGLGLDGLAAAFPGAALVRAMPNMPVRSGHGVVLLAGAADPDIDRLMAPLGTARWIESDATFDLYSALTGSGPAFVYAFMDAFAAAGARLGLPPDDTALLSRAMIEGAVADASASLLSPQQLIAEVASKAGMTQAGLDVLGVDGRFVTLMTDMLRAARDRGKELAQIAAG